MCFIVGTVKAAKARGREPIGWGILAVFLPVIAFIAVWFSGPTRAQHLANVAEEEEVREAVRKREQT